jgi:hypothetical protein
MNSQEEKTLRESIRHAMRLVKKKRRQEELKFQDDEVQLRALVREFLKHEVRLMIEGQTPDNDPAPHRSTGINVLEDLLKKIVPILETDFKLLTTEEEQRKSFRSHIINAVIGTLTPVEVNNDAPKISTDGPALEEEIDIDVSDDDDMFIDVRGEETPEEPEEDDPRSDFGIEGADVTGRNMAYSCFKKIESSVIDAYDLLSNSEDQELFYEYLIANLKLYFDKFESELTTSVEEPTNQAYQDASQETDLGAPEEETIDLEL